MGRTTSFVTYVMEALLLSILFGCGINFQSPNSATEADVLTTKPGIYGLAIGMQQYYATTALSNIIFTPGISTREVAINTTLANLVELELGGTSMLNNNSNVSGLWKSLRRF